ncbi:phosphatidylinositol-3,4-bisphosphate 4-phosphatase [Aureococcus anophagefferens]|nr:phosphatidylinositol-3,4-bisphosphate 4-phosphatase [Aureococcus anophagefferens]
MRSRELDFAATKIEAIADQLAAMRDELEAQAAHADDVYASGRCRRPALPRAARSRPAASRPSRTRWLGRPPPQAVDLKKDAALQFLPTNLNWHQLPASGASRPPATTPRTSNLQPDFNALAVAAAHVGAVRCAPGVATRQRFAAPLARRRRALLLGVECLRTHGDELGMLEDLVAATEWMDSLTLAFADRPRARSDNAAGDWAVSRRPGGGGALLVERRVDGPPRGLPRRGPRRRAELRPRRAATCSATAGSHAICCKSGKDRTAMAVTLEQTRALSRDLRVFDERMLCKLLRAHGVRRRNLLLNTGQDKYAFNAVQVASLPSATGPGGTSHAPRT